MSKRNQSGFGKEMPPSREHIRIYFIQKGLTEQDAAVFYDMQQAGQWKTIRGRQISNWKAVAAEYVWMLSQQKKQLVKEECGYGEVNMR